MPLSLAPEEPELPELELLLVPLPPLDDVEPDTPGAGLPVFVAPGPPPLPLLPRAAANRMEKPNHCVVAFLEPVDGPVHTLRTGEEVRGWPLSPFRIYYQRTEGAFRVLRVYHQKREPIAR